MPCQNLRKLIRDWVSPYPVEAKAAAAAPVADLAPAAAATTPPTTAEETGLGTLVATFTAVEPAAAATLETNGSPRTTPTPRGDGQG